MSNTTNTTTSAPGSDSLREAGLYTLYVIAGAAGLAVLTCIIRCLCNHLKSRKHMAKRHTRNWSDFPLTDSTPEAIIIPTPHNNNDTPNNSDYVPLELSTSQLLEATSSPSILKRPSASSSSLSTSQTPNTTKKVTIGIFEEHERKLNERYVVLNSSPKANSQNPSPKKRSLEKQRLLGSSASRRRAPTAKMEDKSSSASSTPRYGSFDNQ